jgi:single-strand DNA-binding protein
MYDNMMTLVGNLTADPELRYTSSGTAVANFTMAQTPRTYDRATGEWRDGETLFLRCTVWRELAEHMMESVVKGSRVMVVGRLRQRSFAVDEGERRTVIELHADEVAVSLRYATAQVTKVTGVQRGGEQQPETTADGEPPFCFSSPGWFLLAEGITQAP